MYYLIDKDALVAEIEKRKSQNEKWKNSCKGVDALAASMVIQEDINILSFLSTLEVKEISDKYDGFLGKELKMMDDEIERLEKLKVKEVDLDKEIKEVQRKYKTIEEYEGYPCTMYANNIEWIAKHFFELGLKAQKGE